MRHILNINPVKSRCRKTAITDLISKESPKQFTKSLTQTLTRIKKALEGKPQEH
jgi:hypothetical protein